ncbi:hypothetical protein LPB72_13035 [Hydrogenophaga crassostreae]|uniref:Uncharacterized protein n=1 Tax=Hydrogenophaga crassostreae TaxID=1763535 RepID=A0A167HL94_9BURK|nr:hypothetical protein LPB072_21380 [Hydrogenophaga crassostreae]OAD41389.1 hypothetical protein LPB72_13035 [Hydrogenophaga crassostreae]
MRTGVDGEKSKESSGLNKKNDRAIFTPNLANVQTFDGFSAEKSGRLVQMRPAKDTQVPT